ncbi:MAG: O-antigen translocase [Cellvibrio sp.]|uniref:O-antigen translocase n=1 Tax=Cellvibrio sp. TaxID=1965322 RepID=UPI002723E0A9|nr:O-antigen translocase [Cellvibrio sp.]
MTSHRQIFRSSAIIGSASIIGIIIGIIKVKVLAVLLGPVGIGLMGLYQNLMGMASTLAGCGMGSSGVRQLAASSGEAATLAIVRRALWLGNLILGFTGMALLWLLREPVAQWVFGNIAHTSEVGWLGLGVLLTLIAGSQMALLQGLRRIGDLARVSIISAILSAAAGIFLVYWLGEDGVLWFVLTAPAISILVAGYYAAYLPRPQTAHDWQAISQQWQAMLKLGIPIMAAGLFTLATQLAARSIILRELGLDASGYFQAAWTISMTYIGFVLGAMGTDYFPRLTAIIDDHLQARKLVNEQTEMALLLAGPVLLAMITFAPWIIHLLYAAIFAPATDVLRWQVLGDILKVASWPMGFILLAMGRGGIFIGTELTWNVVYLLVIFLGIQKYGLVITGVGFWAAYLIYYGVLALVAARLIGYKSIQRNWMFMLFLLLAGGVVVYVAEQSADMGYGFGLLATLAVGVYSLRRLDGLMDLREWLRKRFGSRDE